MHSLDLPAGSKLRLTATARPEVKLHRWSMRVFDAADARVGALSRLTFGSRIGDGDREQRVDVPPQDAACRVDISCSRAVLADWREQAATVEDDTVERLVLRYPGAAEGAPQGEDILLSFDVTSAAPASPMQ